MCTAVSQQQQHFTVQSVEFALDFNSAISPSHFMWHHEQMIHQVSSLKLPDRSNLSG
jgi:hypothetical protein